MFKAKVRHHFSNKKIKQYDENFIKTLRKGAEEKIGMLHNHPEAGYNGNGNTYKIAKTAFPKSYKNKEKINKYIERMGYFCICVRKRVRLNVRLQITYSNITMGTIPMGIKQNQKYKYDATKSGKI